MQNSMKSLKLGEVMDEPESESAGASADDAAYSHDHHEADGEEGGEEGEDGGAGGSAWDADTGVERVSEERLVTLAGAILG